MTREFLVRPWAQRNCAESIHSQRRPWKSFASGASCLPILLILLLLPAACRRALPGGSGGGSASAGTAAIRLNNVGVAEMNRGRATQALELFRQAARQDPSLFIARLNEGIALLDTQRFPEARDVLLDVTRQRPDNARAWYNLGILYRNIAEVAPAIDAFERVNRLDSSDADALYFLGQLHAQAGRFREAISWYERCLALDALHISAEFGLARAYQLSGDDDGARRHLTRFDELTKSGAGKPISLVYGEQGPYSTAEPVAGVDMAPEAFAVRLTPAASALRIEPGSQMTPSDRILPLLGSGACFLDFDEDSRFDILLLGGRTPLLYRNTGGGQFTDVTARSGMSVAGSTLGCAIADYDNDGQSDVAIGFEDRLTLYRNQGGGTFQDVTATAGIRTDGLPLGLTFVDYDHDGDVDLYVSRFSNFALRPEARFDFPFPPAAPANVLWRNNGNGTFTNWTAESGLAGDAPGIAALPVDFNNDRAVDVLLTGWRRAPATFTNSREGPFRPTEVWKSPFPSAAAGAAAFDFDKDGWMDIAFTHWGQPGVTLWKNLSGAGFERVSLPEPQWDRAWGITAMDIDNDGWLDLAAVGETGEGQAGNLLLLRNLGGRFSDVSKTVLPGGASLARPRALLSGDVDGDGDSDLLITQNGASPVLFRNEGGNRRRSVRLALEGLSDNRSAIGTKVEVFAGALRQKWEVHSSSGYLGQNAPGILAGVDGERQADIVRLLWPTGVPQDEVQLAAGQRHVLREIDRRGSSCPVVFVWDGSRYRFVSDMIGPGIIGEWLGPGERNLPDPTEYLKIDRDLLKPRNGRLSFRFAEVMEEITYLDHVRLVAVDHPADVVVNPNEYFASLPPFPEFKVVTSRNARPPQAAVDDRGRNVLPELLGRDGRYVTGFDSLPYTGYARLHYLELELGNVDTRGPLRFLMHGFIDYFTVTSIFAAYQGNVQAVAPFLEVRTADGSWQRVSEDIGFPAGLARTMVADLSGKIPAGTSRVRIGTNLKIYWDQILIDTTPQTAPVELHEVPAVEATLAYRGYPRRVEGSVRGDVSYIHEDVSPTGPFARARGQYTAYGDVLSLVAAADDRFAIVGSGDEVALEFDPSSLPTVRSGWARDYFLYADGFAKDMDFYSAYSDTVEPLPFHEMGKYPYGPDKRFPDDALRLEYRLRANTRSVGSAGR